MRLCLIGDFRPNLDEGFSNVASNLLMELDKNHEIIKLNLWQVLSLGFWREMRKGRPQIIHYFTAPSTISFWILKALSLYWRGAKTVMSALHPDALSLSKKIIFRGSISRLKPDLILVQSPEVRDMFAGFNCPTRFLLNGVDTKKFFPPSAESKKRLREKYGIAQEKFIILHVGHLKRDRNLQIFRQVQHGNNQVFIVASTYRREDKKLHQELAESGCIVWRHYFPNIEEIYALADCYLFPVRGNACLSLPLSVLEAMACNLPVISTRFGALPTLFGGNDGVLFAEKEESFPSLVDRVKTGSVKVATRHKVLAYSWQSIARDLERVYEEVASDRKAGKRKKSTLICFIGMDGSGKSTLAQALAKTLSENGMKSRYQYNRFKPLLTMPFIILGKTLFFRGKGKAEDYGQYSLTRSKVFKSSLLSAAYEHSILLDYWWQMLWRVTIPLKLGRNIVCDRYIYDTIVDLAVDLSYSEEKMGKILAWLLRLLPKPDHVFLIDVPEEIAFQRKNDTPSLEFLKERRDLYRHLGENCKFSILDGTKEIKEGIEATQNKVLQRV